MRTFLFLQGHPSFFSLELAKALKQQGCRVLRINLCVGDSLYWRGLPAVSFRGRFQHWRSFLSSFIAQENVSDIIYYGDTKPYHRVAADLARQKGINAFVYEFGYLRPDWITLERFGMATNSHFPTDTALIGQIAERLPPPDLACRFPYSQLQELSHEIIYHFSTLLLGWLYPFYRAERYYNLVFEYLHGIPGQLQSGKNHRLATRSIDRMITQKSRFFLYPLQLQSDAQIQFHSPFEHQRDAITTVMESFSAHAEKQSQLIFKQHPLDNGAEHWQRHILQVGHRLGIADRTQYLIGGNLNQLLDHAAGCIVINSTVGLLALQQGCPVKTLGTAVYDIEGITDQGSLDGFFKNPFKPDMKMVRNLVRALAGTIQVKGNFFSNAGRSAAVSAAVKMLLENRVNGEGAFVDPPPRAASP